MLKHGTPHVQLEHALRLRGAACLTAIRFIQRSLFGIGDVCGMPSQGSAMHPQSLEVPQILDHLEEHLSLCERSLSRVASPLFDAGGDEERHVEADAKQAPELWEAELGKRIFIPQGLVPLVPPIAAVGVNHECPTEKLREQTAEILWPLAA